MTGKSFRIITSKQRAIGLFGIAFMFIPFTVGSIWIGLDILNGNWAFPSSLVFSWQAIFTLFFPFISIPVILMGLPVVLYGKDLSDKYSLLLIKVMVGGMILGLITSVVYGFYFTGQLEQRGYIPCRGVPIGYMPGMGKQYVTDISLCR